MITPTYFALRHTYADSWGFYNRPDQSDLDLARDISGLLGCTDPHLEEVLASALAKHRKAPVGGRYVGDDE